MDTFYKCLSIIQIKKINLLVWGVLDGQDLNIIFIKPYKHNLPPLWI